MLFSDQRPGSCTRTNFGIGEAVRSRFRTFLPTMLLMLAMNALGQNIEVRALAGWGTNMLTSPGTELRSSPGRTGYFGAGLIIGNEGRISIQPSVAFHAAAYRTRMAYRVHYVSRRSAIDLDLVLGFPQMNRTTLIAGGFIGTLTEARAFVEQRGRDRVQALPHFFTQQEEHATPTRAGIVLGMSIPLSTGGRLVLDFRLRQHVIPLVDEDRSQALVFEAAQQVLATNTRPTELTVGLSFQLNKQAE